MILSIDLASKLWAGCLGDEGQVRRQISSWDFASESDGVSAITYLFRPDSKVNPRWLIIEDVPFHSAPMTSGKDAIRFQGRIIDRMDSYGQKDKLLFVQPMEWQKFHKVVRQGDEGYAKCALDKFGYSPPDMLTKFKKSYISLHGKERADIRYKLKKLQTDYVAAFLIYQWAYQITDEVMLKSKAVQRYER